MSATHQDGRTEWKRKANGKKACRFRYRIRDETKPEGWRKKATAWEEGLTAKQAKKRLREVMLSIDFARPETPPTVPEIQGLTLNGFVESHFEKYQHNRGIKDSTRASNAASLNNHILPMLGSRPICEISPSHISDFFQMLDHKHLSTKSVLNIYQLLHVLFEVAAEHDLIEENPVRRKLHRPRHIRKKMPIWSADVVQKILKEVSARWRVLFWCIALTGVRVGELLALAMERYRLERKDDHIREGLLERAAAGFNKNRSGTRPAYASKFGERPCGPPPEFQKYRSR